VVGTAVRSNNVAADAALYRAHTPNRKVRHEIMKWGDRRDVDGQTFAEPFVFASLTIDDCEKPALCRSIIL
jgi:hypothetical protein